MSKRAKIILFLGSLRFAVSLILILSVTLIYATFFESLHGTAAVQYSIYKTWWFGLLLILIGTSVSIAALKKYPWKIHQIGFLVTHLGLVVLIIGSFVSFNWGIDANLSLLNHEEKNFYSTREEIIKIAIPEKKILFSKALESGPYERDGDLVTISPSKDLSITVDRFLPFANETSTVVETEKDGYAAIELQLQNQFVNFQEQFILDETKQVEKNLGPATIIFKEIKNEKELQAFLNTRSKNATQLGELHLTIADRSWHIKLTKENLLQNIPVPKTSFVLKNVHYFPYAIVENNKLVNKDNNPHNPAIKLALSGPRGDEEHIAFSLFPDFPSTHQQHNLYGAKIAFIHQNGLSTNNLSIGVTPNQKLYYRVSSSHSLKSGEMHIGQAYETGWMNIKFKIQKYLPQAMHVTRYAAIKVQDPNNPKVFSAIRLRFENEKEKKFYWLSFGENKNIAFNNTQYEVSYEVKKEPLPFSLYLEEFHMGKDPGTSTPASYQSRVTLKDEFENRLESHLISMNEPLTYQGYTFYQSSYRTDDEGNPIGSVLSVGYDPGRVLKYSGSIFLVLGIMLLFFFRRVYIQVWQEYKARKTKTVSALEEELHVI